MGRYQPKKQHLTTKDRMATTQYERQRRHIRMLQHPYKRAKLVYELEALKALKEGMLV